jgi:hypothetical protein
MYRAPPPDCCILTTVLFGNSVINQGHLPQNTFDDYSSARRGDVVTLILMETTDI